MAQQQNVTLNDVGVSLQFILKRDGCPADDIEAMVGSIKDQISDFKIPKKTKNPKNVLLVTLDFDCCSAIATLLFEGIFPNKNSSIRRRFEMDDYYNGNGSLKKGIKLAENFVADIRVRIKNFKDEHPDGIVIGLNGSYRQDCEIDTFNRNYQNITSSINYHKYNAYFNGVVPSGTNGLVCVRGGDLEYIFKLLEIDYIPQCYADGDGEAGCSLGRMDLTVVNNRSKKLKNALGEPIKSHGENKQGLVEFHLAKMQQFYPGANVHMLFYDDKLKYLNSIKKTPLRETESVTAIYFEGWPDAENMHPKVVFSDVSYKKASAAVG